MDRQQISNSDPHETVPGSRSILVVDEEEQTSQHLSESLASLGHQVDFLQSVVDFQLADLDLTKFDLVICDSETALGVWRLLLARIRSQRLRTQLVLTSRKAEESEWLEALQLGVFDLLPKPLSKSEVQRVAVNALAMNYNSNFM